MTPVAEFSAAAVEFLSAGTRTGMLGFVVDEGDLVLNTAKASAKGQALMRDPRVVTSVRDSARTCARRMTAIGHARDHRRRSTTEPRRAPAAVDV
jgi:hypothetical protein